MYVYIYSSITIADVSLKQETRAEEKLCGCIYHDTNCLYK